MNQTVGHCTRERLTFGPSDALAIEWMISARFRPVRRCDTPKLLRLVLFLCVQEAECMRARWCGSEFRRSVERTRIIRSPDYVLDRPETNPVGALSLARTVRGMLPTVHLIRHGATEWSVSGRHTGLTDIPLTSAGESEARDLRDRLRGISFVQVLTSPLIRARRTCELTELSLAPEIDPDLREWNYGDFEGLRTPEIFARGNPQWNVFKDGCPNGESPDEVTARADRIVARLRLLSGEVAVFSHAHFLRALAARWIGLPITTARRLYLNTGSISVVGFEHGRADEPVIQLWNERLRIR